MRRPKKNKRRASDEHLFGPAGAKMSTFVAKATKRELSNEEKIERDLALGHRYVKEGVAMLMKDLALEKVAPIPCAHHSPRRTCIARACTA